MSKWAIQEESHLSGGELLPSPPQLVMSSSSQCPSPPWFPLALSGGADPEALRLAEIPPLIGVEEFLSYIVDEKGVFAFAFHALFHGRRKEHARVITNGCTRAITVCDSNNRLWRSTTRVVLITPIGVPFG